MTYHAFVRSMDRSLSRTARRRVSWLWAHEPQLTRAEWRELRRYERRMVEA